ncbi:MAG: universal stress protein [Gemmatimonadota bacterium]
MKKHALRTVLATSDLTEGSEAALRTAAVLAAGEGSGMRLFHCVPRRVPPYWKGAGNQREQEERIHSARQELEQQFHRVLGEDAPPVEIDVAVGIPVQEIARFADSIAADVVVLGQHTPRTALDDLLGTTADRMIRTSERPCLIAHQAITRPLEQVMVATDFSKHARKALETVVDWLAGPLAPERRDPPGSAEVNIVHVQAFATRMYRPFGVDALLEKETEAARRRLPGGSPVTIRASTFSAPLEVEGVTAATEQFQPDLVVMGTHGYSFVARTLLGSIAAGVASTVRCPLLLVPLRVRMDGEG